MSVKPLSWVNAKDAAENRIWEGMNGYLATITSSSENEFIYNMVGFHSWFGGSDEAVEGEWRWVTGPEGLENDGKGQLFWLGNGAIDGTPVEGRYHHWYSPNPNDALGDEDYAYMLKINTPLTSFWNDNSKNSLRPGYIVEYGGMPDDPEIVIGEPPNQILDEKDIETHTLNDINVTSFEDAQIAIELTDASLSDIDKIRSNLGSTQNQFASTIANISNTIVNVSKSESSIMDLDISDEMGNFSKMKILAEASAFASSQANSSAEMVLNLLTQQ